MFYITVELVLKSYMPKVLEKGMIFIHPKDTILWKLDKNIHPDQKEQFLIENGAPVEPYLVLRDHEKEEIIATPEQIGWWDDGPDYDELRDVAIEDFNGIINTYEGRVDVQLETEPQHDDFVKDHILIVEGKVVMSPAPRWEEFDEDEWVDDSEG